MKEKKEPPRVKLTGSMPEAKILLDDMTSLRLCADPAVTALAVRTLFRNYQATGGDFYTRLLTSFWPEYFVPGKDGWMGGSVPPGVPTTNNSLESQNRWQIKAFAMDWTRRPVLVLLYSFLQCIFVHRCLRNTNILHRLLTSFKKWASIFVKFR
jgi:hypothetical protein